VNRAPVANDLWFADQSLSTQDFPVAWKSGRSWGLTAHRGWARLLLDRRCLVQVPNAPYRRSRADEDHYEEREMESYFYPEAGHHASPES
jgi:hypothetical protein